ncbi:hypothetical protein Trydic_g15580 [Trypoxylus dichotomus]
MEITGEDEMTAAPKLGLFGEHTLIEYIGEEIQIIAQILFMAQRLSYSKLDEIDKLAEKDLILISKWGCDGTKVYILEQSLARFYTILPTHKIGIRQTNFKKPEQKLEELQIKFSNLMQQKSMFLGEILGWNGNYILQPTMPGQLRQSEVRTSSLLRCYICKAILSEMINLPRIG